MKSKLANKTIKALTDFDPTIENFIKIFGEEQGPIEFEEYFVKYEENLIHWLRSLGHNETKINQFTNYL